MELTDDEVYDLIEDHIVCAYHDLRDLVTRDPALPPAYDDPATGIFHYDDRWVLLKWFAIIASLGICDEQIVRAYPFVAEAYLRDCDDMLDAKPEELAATDAEVARVRAAREIADAFVRGETGKAQGLGRVVQECGPDGLREAITVALLYNWLLPLVNPGNG